MDIENGDWWMECVKITLCQGWDAKFGDLWFLCIFQTYSRLRGRGFSLMKPVTEVISYPARSRRVIVPFRVTMYIWEYFECILLLGNWIRQNVSFVILREFGVYFENLFVLYVTWLATSTYCCFLRSLHYPRNHFRECFEEILREKRFDKNPLNII